MPAKTPTVAAAAALLTSGAVRAETIFTLDSTSNLSLSHNDTTAAARAAAPPQAGSQNVGNGIFTWTELASDSGGNTAIFSGGDFSSTDWGGLGRFTSSLIDVTGFKFVNINGIFSGSFNSPPTEFSRFFFRLDAGATSFFGQGTSGTSTNQAVASGSVDTSSASTLTLGFEYDHNGGSDRFSVSELVATGTPPPPPANSPPAFSEASFVFAQNSGDGPSVTFSVSATDPQNNPLTFGLVGNPDFVTATSTSGGLFSFTSTPVDEDDFGAFDFQVSVSDGEFTSFADVQLTVIPEPLAAGGTALLSLVALRRRRAC